MDGVAIGVNGGDHYLASVVPQDGGGLHRTGPPLDGDLERAARVVHPEGNVADAVAVLGNVSRGGMIGSQRRGEQQPDLVLLQQIAGPISGAGLRPAVAGQLKPERRPVVVAGLLGVADIELDEVGAVNGKGIGSRGGCGHGLGVHETSWGDSARPASTGRWSGQAAALTERYLWA